MDLISYTEASEMWLTVGWIGLEVFTAWNHLFVVADFCTGKMRAHVLLHTFVRSVAFGNAEIDGYVGKIAASAGRIQGPSKCPGALAANTFAQPIQGGVHGPC